MIHYNDSRMPSRLCALCNADSGEVTIEINKVNCPKCKLFFGLETRWSIFIAIIRNAIIIGFIVGLLIYGVGKISGWF